MLQWLQWKTSLPSKMNLRNCTNHNGLVQQIMLDHVQKYVDERAHLVRDELRYSIQLPYRTLGRTKMKWERRVLGNKEMKRIFRELYP